MYQICREVEPDVILVPLADAGGPQLRDGAVIDHDPSTSLRRRVQAAAGTVRRTQTAVVLRIGCTADTQPL